MSLDIHFGSVASLMHMDGTHGGTTFTDETGKTVTVGGSVTTTTSTYKYGTAAGDFPGGASDKLSLAASDDFNFGAGCFTIEAWVKWANSVTRQYMTIVEKDDGAFGVGSWSLLANRVTDSAGDFALYVRDFSAVTPLLSSGTGYDDNAWHHIAVTRNGNWFYLFVDGTLQGTGDSTITVTDLSATTLIGNSVFATRGWTGQMDDVRITKGVARYTTVFTVPPAAFGDDLPNGGEVGATGFQGLSGTSIFGPPGQDGTGTVAGIVLPPAPAQYEMAEQRQLRRTIEQGFKG